MQFADKVVVITGAGSGIGRTCALRFAAEGGKVVIAEYNAEAGQATVQRITEAGGTASFVQTDVSNSASVQAMIQHAVSTYGRLDVLYNNAGVAGEVKPVADYSEDVFARTMGVDLFGVFFGMKYGLQQFERQGNGGVIVNMASTAGLRATPGMIAYSASKFAVVGMTMTAALEYADKNIRINAVCPGAIETEGLKSMGAELLQQYVSHQPMKRFGTPDEVANAVLFLASDAASLLTGIAMPTDGGLSTR
ncbi:MAG: SDR family NAD(P)-dependent oxidoreductase [Janthinobacterium lividum]